MTYSLIYSMLYSKVLLLLYYIVLLHYILGLFSPKQYISFKKKNLYSMNTICTSVPVPSQIIIQSFPYTYTFPVKK